MLTNMSAGGQGRTHTRFSTVHHEGRNTRYSNVACLIVLPAPFVTSVSYVRVHQTETEGCSGFAVISHNKNT